MSDAPQGEGWWQASDGQWYPPPTTPPAPSPAAGDAPADLAAPAAPVVGDDGGGGGGSKVLIGVVAMLVGLLLGAGITWAVTGGDDAGGGDDWSAFCDKAAELDAADEGGDLSDEEGQAAFAELVALAPERYQELLDPLAEMMATGDEPADAESMEMFGDLFGGLLYLVGVLQVECGLDMGDDSLLSGSGGMDLDMGGSFEMDEGDLGLGEDADDPTGDTTDDAFDDDPFEDDSFSDEPMDIDVIEAWLLANYPDAPWREAISSWSVSNDEYVIVAPGEAAFSDDDALAACEAIAEYVFGQVPDGTVEVTTPEGNVQASADEGAPCSLVAD